MWGDTIRPDNVGLTEGGADGVRLRDEGGELRWGDSLLGVGERCFGMGVHLDQQPVCACRDGRDAHRDDEIGASGRVAGVHQDGQVRELRELCAAQESELLTLRESDEAQERALQQLRERNAFLERHMVDSVELIARMQQLLLLAQQQDDGQ